MVEIEINGKKNPCGQPVPLDVLVHVIDPNFLD